MRLITCMMVLLPSLAMAQDVGDTMWIASEDAESTRFMGADPTPGPTFDADAAVIVLAKADGRVRVKAKGGDRYGWVLPSVLTTSAPEGASPSGLEFKPQLTMPPGMKTP